MKQEQHLFKVAKYIINDISVKVSYSRNAIQQKA
nr:MAG TPA: cAMP-dependent protein kinase type I [Caudoviricetes sp.]